MTMTTMISQTQITDICERTPSVSINGKNDRMKKAAAKQPRKTKKKKRRRDEVGKGLRGGWGGQAMNSLITKSFSASPCTYTQRTQDTHTHDTLPETMG